MWNLIRKHKSLLLLQIDLEKLVKKLSLKFTLGIGNSHTCCQVCSTQQQILSNQESEKIYKI